VVCLNDYHSSYNVANEGLVEPVRRERIADYKVPDTVVFVDDLPVNATFKVDTWRLREMAVSRQLV
jgi:non-ribosomal peptide synthetase component E (peptide arylation enzyme)